MGGGEESRSRALHAEEGRDRGILERSETGNLERPSYNLNQEVNNGWAHRQTEIIGEKGRKIKGIC